MNQVPMINVIDPDGASLVLDAGPIGAVASVHKNRHSLLRSSGKSESLLAYINSEDGLLDGLISPSVLSSLFNYWEAQDASWQPIEELSDACISRKVVIYGMSSVASSKKIVCFLGTAKPSSLEGENLTNAFLAAHMMLNETIQANRTIAEFEEDADPVGSGLTNSETRVLTWCASGKTSFEISKILKLSEHTVNHYISSATHKLDAVNRTHAIAKAIKTGVIALNDIS